MTANQIRLLKLKKWDSVSVTWEDAAHEGDPQTSYEYVKGYKPHIRHTGGWFLANDGKRIFVALSKDVQVEVDDYDCQAIDILPHGMILEIKVLHHKKKPAAK